MISDNKSPAPLRDELAWLRSRYDHVQVSPAVYAAIRRLEIEIAWADHHRGSKPGAVR
jgi:hypothetical protein